MKIKKSVWIALFAAIWSMTMMGLTGCGRKGTQIDQAEPAPIEFKEEEAFRIGGNQVGIDMFMLFAIDAIPGFVSEFGEDCWSKEIIDLSWRRETPQRALILYLTDIISSAIACDIYYSSNVGELEASVKEICADTAHERYDNLLKAGMPEGVVTEDSIYQYTCLTYRLSYVVDELSAAYEQDRELIQAAIIGMRDSIDENFDYDRNINWSLVETIDYSSAYN